jgi:aspartate racemase
MNGWKHAGILAHSAEGAALCFRTFCQEGFRALGEHEHPDVTLTATAMARSMEAWESGDHATIRGILLEGVQRLASAGAHFFVCPDNTAHIALEVDGAPFPIPCLHIADVVAERAKQDGRRKVGLLGTKYLVRSEVYPAALASRGIEAVRPDARSIELVSRVIFGELVNGVFTEESRKAFIAIIHNFAAQGCDAVGLVCTEIPLLVTPDVSPLPLLDSTRLQAASALRIAIGQEPLPTWRCDGAPR